METLFPGVPNQVGKSQGVGGSDKQPLEWKFLGGGGGGDGGGGESKARLLRTFSRVEVL